MLNAKTLFVVGAGASKELNLPVGSELRGYIAQLLNITFDYGARQTGDGPIIDALKVRAKAQQERTLEAYTLACWLIRDAMPMVESIDSFINNHRDDARVELCGKLAIARSILQAERNSLIGPTPRRDRAVAAKILEPTWYSRLFHLLFDDVSKSEAARAFSNVDFICFNYDRCLEQALVHGFQIHYGFNETDAQALAAEVRVRHPYGVVGCLPWQQGTTSVPFGSDDHNGPLKLLEIASQVKTYSERIEENDELAALRRLVEEAETIVFLGFAFHRSNMRLIEPKEMPVTNKVFASTYGMADARRNALSDELTIWLGQRRSAQQLTIHAPEIKCFDLLREHRHGMP